DVSARFGESRRANGGAPEYGRIRNLYHTARPELRNACSAREGWPVWESARPVGQRQRSGTARQRGGGAAVDWGCGPRADLGIYARRLADRKSARSQEQENPRRR